MTDLEYLTLTIYGEARGESIEGQVAVGSVIRNRSIKARKNSKNSSYKAICLAEKQFSCWNKDDPNYPKLKKLMDNWYNYKEIPDDVQQSYWVARGIMLNILKSNVGKADHYMTVKLFESNKRPKWANKMKVVKVIGNHIFLMS